MFLNRNNKLSNKCNLKKIKLKNHSNLLNFSFLLFFHLYYQEIYIFHLHNTVNSFFLHGAKDTKS